MNAPNFKELTEAYERMNYKFFSKGSYNPNFWGIRSLDSKSNKFDDIGGVTFYESLNKPIVLAFPMTSDPGKYWLQNPLNKNGCAILIPGQYEESHALGVHGRSGPNPYKAFEQVNKMMYVRDNDRNDTLDFSLYRDPVKRRIHAFFDNIKSNIHRASALKIVQFVERYSAACQVYQNVKDFDKLIQVMEFSIRKGYPNRVTYTLFEENEVWK